MAELLIMYKKCVLMPIRHSDINTCYVFYLHFTQGKKIIVFNIMMKEHGVHLVWTIK